MIKGRLFTFGCSMTKYHYPTWADILGKNWEYFENWGRGGAGNQFIFNSIIECDQHNRFNESDTVLILWSALSRYDYYQFGQWLHESSVFPDKFEKMKYNCPDGQEMFTYAWACAVHQYLKSKNVKFKSMRWVEWDSDSPVVNCYRDTYNEIEKIDLEFNLTRYPIRVERKNAIEQREISLYDREQREISLYKRIAGPDWPSLQEILSSQYKINDTFVSQEIDEFLKVIASERTRIEKKLIEIGDVDKHPLPLQHLKAAKKICPTVEIGSEIQEWAQSIETSLLAGKSYDFCPVDPKQRL